MLSWRGLPLSSERPRSVLWLAAASLPILSGVPRSTAGRAEPGRRQGFRPEEMRHLRLVVQKFGGSSVATAERITNAARKAIRAQQAGNQVVVVVSARGDTTDDLIDMAREISEQPP